MADRPPDMEIETIMRSLIARILAPVGNGNCGRCGAPLTPSGNCSQLCGGA